jgi:hypothetical protein
LEVVARLSFIVARQAFRVGLLVALVQRESGGSRAEVPRSWSAFHVEELLLMRMLMITIMIMRMTMIMITIAITIKMMIMIMIMVIIMIMIMIMIMMMTLVIMAAGIMYIRY